MLEKKALEERLIVLLQESIKRYKFHSKAHPSHNNDIVRFPAIWPRGMIEDRLIH